LGLYYLISKHLLTFCGEYDYFEMAKWLISVGATVKTENSAALFAACHFDNLHLVKLFYEHGAPLRYYNSHKDCYLSAFWYSCYHQNYEIAQWLYQYYKPSKYELHKIIKEYDESCDDDIKDTELYKWVLKLYNNTT
jgi:hypothetical protein